MLLNVVTVMPTKGGAPVRSMALSRVLNEPFYRSESTGTMILSLVSTMCVAQEGDMVRFPLKSWFHPLKWSRFIDPDFIMVK